MVNLGFLLLFFLFDTLVMKIAIVNGPNLNLLGRRKPEIYGTATLADILADVRAHFPDIDIVDCQSNSEGVLIDTLQSLGYAPEIAGIVFNPGAYAHYSIALADAIEAIPCPVVEVHISNIHAREEFRRVSVTARTAAAVITGCGAMGYQLAVQYLISRS